MSTFPFVLKGHERPVTIIRFNYDGDLFFSGSFDKKINLWEAYTGERIGCYTAKSAVKSLDVDINSEYLVYCANDGIVECFHVQTGKPLVRISFGLRLKHVEFNCNSSKLLLLGDEFLPNPVSYIYVLDFEVFKTLAGEYTPYEAAKSKLNLDNHPLNHRIAVVSRCFPSVFPQLSFPYTIEEHHRTPEHIKCCTKLLWYVDDKSIFASTNTGEIFRFAETGHIQHHQLVHKGYAINAIAFSKDFSILATAAQDGAKILDPETLQQLRHFPEEFSMNTISISPLFCSEVTPKYHMAMGGGVSAMDAAMSVDSGFEVRLCNVMHNTEIGKIGGHFGPVNSIEFFRDGKGFVSGAEEGTIRVVRFMDAYFDPKNQQYE